ncbi:MAG: DUF523 domain-containing protein [Acidobacteria bacterium CG_4_9_14_3_um_filter_49_7]|nr:MAG: DUF523 domain-containing protein [Acidobacteria bacterium CG_4_9_14_3_um_filter_49_7]
MKQTQSTEKVLVSACLLGYRCRYNAELLEVRTIPEPADAIVLVCPEELGSLPTPRPRSFFEDEHTGADLVSGVGGRVITEAGEDLTSAFLAGARRTLAIAREVGARKAYLKERSPSCGCNTIYVQGEQSRGKGVTAALLEKNGIEIVPVE